MSNLDNLYSKPPTHIDATHAISKFDQNQVNHDKRLYQNVENTEVMQSANLNSKPSTHIDATYAITKFDQNFQNRIPMELHQNFHIPGIGMIH